MISYVITAVDIGMSGRRLADRRDLEDAAHARCVLRRDIGGERQESNDEHGEHADRGHEAPPPGTTRNGCSVGRSLVEPNRKRKRGRDHALLATRSALATAI